MAQSSIRGGSAAPARQRGTSTEMLGPSDSSDSGSDSQVTRPRRRRGEDRGIFETESDTDAEGTGERAAADGDDVPDAADISPDRVVRVSPDAPDALDGGDRIDLEDFSVDDADSPDEGEADDLAPPPREPRP